jgi:hypothetical protein
VESEGKEMNVVDKVQIALLAKLPLVRLQFSTGAFGASTRWQVDADVALTYETAEELHRLLGAVLGQVHLAQKNAASVAMDKADGSIN